MIVVVAESFFVDVFVQKASAHRLLRIAGIRARLIQSHRIKACKHSHIRKDRDVIFGMAVTVRRHIDHQIDVERRTSVDNRLRVFCDLNVQILDSRFIFIVDRIEIACAQTPSTAHAFLMIDDRLLLREGDGPEMAPWAQFFEQTRQPTQTD